MEQTQGVPAGYVLVPVEPTPEMMQAGIDKMPHFTDEPGPVWAAMLSAAPQAQPSADGDPWDETQLDGIFNAIKSNCGPATAGRVRAILVAHQAQPVEAEKACASARDRVNLWAEHHHVTFVSRSHGMASTATISFDALCDLAAQPAQPVREPMSREQISKALTGGEHGYITDTVHQIARDIERACADSWGVKLAGIGSKGGAEPKPPVQGSEQ